MSAGAGWAGIFVLFSVTGLAVQSGDREYRTQDCAFRYPASFKLFTTDHGRTILLQPQSRAAYWSDTITIRKQNKETNECDIPQDCQPDSRDHRPIAGRVAFAYSGEDAAMNRYVKTKGYMIEHGGFCWDFQLVRTGKPYQKFDLPKAEQKRLDKQSDLDSRAAKSAFDTILNSFVFLSKR